MGSTYRELFKLYDLIQSGDVSAVEKFVRESEIDINDILECKGIGVLHLAVGIEPEESSKQCTEILLRHKANPNLSNYEGITPVHIAAIWGRLDNLKLLIGCGGDPSRRDVDGHSAFDYAAREEQWDVFDYLHNVEDQQDDEFSSPPCAYSLDLDKIIVTTDQMVAEYETIPDNRTWSASCRKSEMVRDWCEKTSLTVNKLYPTIVSDTFTIDTGSEQWRSINLTKNITLDLTSDFTHSCNETNNTFKTCLSKKLSPQIEISGIERLQITSDESKDSCHSELNKRFSVYENFSLPGSPNSITHRNYNSKSSLKRKQSKESSHSDKRLQECQSIFTEDNSIYDKALAVVQNRTNEWLSVGETEGGCTEVGGFNTRRSSASSGVSSHLSSGSIVLADVQEEYKYEDKEESVVLIEKRLRVTPVVLPVEDPVDSSPNATILSVASSLPASLDYDNNTLRAELIKLGFQPGPIEQHRTLYLKKLHSLKKNLANQRTTGTQNVPGDNAASGQVKTYSVEIEKSLRSADWMSNLKPYIELERKAINIFSAPQAGWRSGSAKTSFTYLLLDPRVSRNLPARAPDRLPAWRAFLDSIFYVGKGKRSRPYSHLYQALNLWKANMTQAPHDKKVQHILDIWSSQVGVVCLHVFQNVIPAEAFTNEAAMIDALEVNNLKNLKRGEYHGAVATWPYRERRMLGQYLLYKAMLIFLSEGEKQLRPSDID